MSIRTAHGTGANALLRVEQKPLDELRPLNAEDTVEGLAQAKRRGRPFEKGNRAAENRKPALALLGVPLTSTDPRCRAALRQANSLRQRRVRELAIAHGGFLGAGPCSMLGSAARALAASTLLYTLATEAVAAGKVDQASKLFAQSAKLADMARQQELTAVGLAEREARSRKAAARPVDAHAALVAALSTEGA